jgi:GDP-4-dehydro-6-deoxy-D-mannose reductase
MKVLVTGITGFVGSHLAELLLKKGMTVYGIERWRSKKDNVEHLKEKIHFLYCDMRDATAIHEVIFKIKPNRIFHLAAQSFVPTSWLAPAETLTTNILGELNLFEAVRQSGLKPTIQIACSSEEYGVVYPNELPIKETNPLRPLSPYGVSKVGQDLLGYQYFKSYGLKVIRTRAFNHTGPRRGDVFMTSSFAKQIALIEKGLQPPILWVGNLAPRRDFTDVRDVVRAYWLATEKGKPGEVYNICSGKDYSARQVLSILLKLTRKKIAVRQDPKRMRPSDVMRLLGNNTKFRKATGWKPEIPFTQTLEDLLNYWRERV